MDDLNEGIACYIEQLEKIKRDGTLTIEQKIDRLKSEAKCMSQEQTYLYEER
tara:strand:+ start:482 stop:637 length:156 start_codon:yes stop_codon:yes gene_type:complete